jgi:hypothetical protein
VRAPLFDELLHVPDASSRPATAQHSEKVVELYLGRFWPRKHTCTPLALGVESAASIMCV